MDISQKFPPTCRVAVIGAQRQRVAKVTALLHADESYGSVATTSLLSLPSTASDIADVDNLPKGVPPTVEIEYLPCVATFDSYEDERGATVRYLAKLEYHGPNGTLVKGKTLAPFFDDYVSDGESDDSGASTSFPGIAAVAIGCGIEVEEDVTKITSFLEALSTSCAKETDKGVDQCGMIIECIKPKEEREIMGAERLELLGL